jgi:hypothetical protein
LLYRTLESIQRRNLLSEVYIRILLMVGVLIVSLSSFADEKYDPNVLAREQPSEYTSYLADLFKGYPPLSAKTVSAQPKLIKGTSAYRFRTEILRQTKISEANFAGGWILIVVGQGTGAARYFLMQALTGKLVDPKLLTENGIPLFEATRPLLVTSGSVGEKNLQDAKKGAWGGPKAWIWKDEKFQVVKLE